MNKFNIVAVKGKMRKCYKKNDPYSGIKLLDIE